MLLESAPTGEEIAPLYRCKWIEVWEAWGTKDAGEETTKWAVFGERGRSPFWPPYTYNDWAP